MNPERPKYKPVEELEYGFDSLTEVEEMALLERLTEGEAVRDERAIEEEFDDIDYF
jgi:hypothetical protein